MAVLNALHAHGLSLPNRFCSGQVFAFSGIDGDNRFAQDWHGVLTQNAGEIRFGCTADSSVGILLRFTNGATGFDAVIPDLIAAKDGEILLTFADAQTLVGRSNLLPAIRLGSEEYIPGERTIPDGVHAISLAVRQTQAGFDFALCRRSDAETAEADAANALRLDAAAMAEKVLDWYLSCPPCPDAGYERLWYKCLSVIRAGIFSPQNGSARYFITPDRLSCRAMQLQNACFQALATVHFAPRIAVDTVLSLLERMCGDRSDAVDEMQLPFLCATIWSLFEGTGDLDLLRQSAEPLRRYLDRILRLHRSPNGLIARQSPSASAEPVDALDRSVFTANELSYLHRIYMMIGDHTAALQTDELHRELAERINLRLWDRQTLCCYDRTYSGAFRRTLTTDSFLPLFAGLCDPRQAHCLLSHLTPLLDCPFPVPGAADKLSGVRLSRNYFIYIGLQRYGFGRQASLLRRKTLEGVRKQFRETGCIFGEYDSSTGSPLADAGCSETASFVQLLLRS